MTTPITEFTTYDDVRAAIGVSSDDIADETLALDLYAEYLDVELEEVADGVSAMYATCRSADTPSDDQTAFLKATRLFAVFAVAKQLTASLPLFAAKQVSDSKATVQRFDNPYRDTIKNVGDQYSRMKTRLLRAFQGLSASSSTSTAKVYFAVVAPSTDPITGL